VLVTPLPVRAAPVQFEAAAGAREHADAPAADLGIGALGESDAAPDAAGRHQYRAELLAARGVDAERHEPVLRWPERSDRPGGGQSGNAPARASVEHDDPPAGEGGKPPAVR
jgi:hypothetical protein